jgi:HAMP domain-containing protein
MLALNRLQERYAVASESNERKARIVTDPIFWLGLSLGCVALGLLLLCVAMLPAARDLQRAARSLERLANTLDRELPATLESFRQTGLELGDLTENVTSSVRHASETLGHVNQSVATVRRQTQRAHGTARGAIAGLRAAWRVLRNPDQADQREDDRDQWLEGAETVAQTPPRRDRKLEREPRYQPDSYDDSYDDL